MSTEAIGGNYYRRLSSLIRREIWLLIVLTMSAVGLYFATRALAIKNARMRGVVAASWYREGQTQFAANRFDAAVVTFRKAVVNDHDNQAYALALAEALDIAHHEAEAHQLLLQLRVRAPEDPEINIQLARIAARQNDNIDAVRYYHNALFGLWKGEDVDQRRLSTRRELISFLIAEMAQEPALAEIIALGGQLPNTLAAHLELAHLFLAAGDAHRAFANFTQVLQRQPKNTAALAGAGQAAFQLKNYSQAYRFLAALSEPNKSEQEILQTSLDVLQNDPALASTYRERGRRLAAAFKRAHTRLKDCLTRAHSPVVDQSTLSSLEQRALTLKATLVHKRVRTDVGLATSVLDLVYDVEQSTSRICGKPEGLDLVLLLISERDR